MAAHVGADSQSAGGSGGVGENLWGSLSAQRAQWTCVVTGREDLIRTIHGQDPNIYAPFATPTIEPMIGAGSMLILSGDPHRRERRLMMPMFHGDRMKAYGLSMQQTALAQFDRFRANGQIVTLDLMTAISLEVIVKTIFGGRDPQLTDRLMVASRALVANSHPLLFFSRKTHLSLLGFSPWDRYVNAKKRLFQLLDEAITARQRSDDEGDDILSLLCSATYEDGEKITRDHIYAELLTFLFAGHETTALSLTWAIYHLHSHAHVLFAIAPGTRRAGRRFTRQFGQRSVLESHRARNPAHSSDRDRDTAQVEGAAAAGRICYSCWNRSCPSYSASASQPSDLSRTGRVPPGTIHRTKLLTV